MSGVEEGSLLIALRAVRAPVDGKLLIDLRERSVVRVGPPRQNLLKLLGEDIEDDDEEESVSDEMEI